MVDVLGFPPGKVVLPKAFAAVSAIDDFLAHESSLGVTLQGIIPS
jgi:hypothetical protein